jgi:hypothetical protein
MVLGATRCREAQAARSLGLPEAAEIGEQHGFAVLLAEPITDGWNRG